MINSKTLTTLKSSAKFVRWLMIKRQQYLNPPM